MIEHIPELDRDIHLVSVPAQSIAEELKAPKASNMVMLGCYLGIRGGLSEKAVEAALQKAFVDAVKRPDLIPINRAAIERGRELALAGN
jgi:Pyruvate/2-oxoacid:ferredoxin oxidoreductase gamma subunit